MTDGMSWAGASWARSLELAEQDYEAWRPKEKAMRYEVKVSVEVDASSEQDAREKVEHALEKIEGMTLFVEHVDGPLLEGE